MSNLDDAIKALGKEGIAVAALDVMRLDTKIEKFPTGLSSLDYILGGGYPRGRVIEIYGWESSGKTTMCLLALAAIQRAGGKACLIDAEHAFDPEWAAQLGVDVGKLLISQPDSGEQAFTILDKLAATGEVDMIVVDSVAAMVPQKELENGICDMNVGTQARMMSQGLRRLTATCAKGHTTAIFINQLRHKIGVMYGNPETTPGGMALKFYASLRMKVTKKEKIQETKEAPVMGHKVKVDIIKTKVSRPYLSTDFNLMVVGGIDIVTDTVNSAVAAGVITREVNNYMFNGTKLALGYDAMVEALRADPVVHEDVRSAVTKRALELKDTPIGSVVSIEPEVKKKKTK